jgi:RHS repeat-associated protein
MISKRGKKVYLTDHLGSVLNSPLGGEFKAYGPFGTSTHLGNLFSQIRREEPVMYGFTGRQFDPESGLYYYRARMYDPSLGRFTTRDPIGFAGGDANLYRYVLNQPLKYVDPSGRTIADVQRATDFINIFAPIGFTFSVSFMSDPNNDVSSRPAIIPGGKNEIVLSDEFLKHLTEDQLLKLLDTVFHETRHLQDGFFTTMFGGMTGRHDEIGMEALKFTDAFSDAFLALTPNSERVCKQP